MSTVAIVGANRGIGLEFCKQFKDAGFAVTAFCRKSSPELASLGVTVVEGFDVGNENSTAEIAGQFTAGTFDIFVHVAGIMKPTPWPDFESRAIMEQFKINGLAPLTTLRHFAPAIKDGAMVAVLTSRMGSIADNDSGGSYGYRMSKAALNAAVKSLSIDTKNRQWTVLTLHPGWVQTDMTGGTGQLTTTESVAGMMKLLTSKTSADTGKFFHTNGEELPW